MGTDLKFEFKIDLKPVWHNSNKHRMLKLSQEEAAPISNLGLSDKGYARKRP